MKFRVCVFAMGVSLCAAKAHSQTLTTLVRFTGIGGTASGANPFGSLTLAGTVFYGMTGTGSDNKAFGPYGLGTIFSVGTNGTDFQTLISFTGSSGSSEGQGPTGGVTLAGATLYGTTDQGGANDYGCVFSVGTNGANYQTLVSFTGTGGTASGNGPVGNLALAGATLYGTTWKGGTDGFGNVFSVGTNGTDYRNLLSFTGTGGLANGDQPLASLTLAGTTLYGMTEEGGIGYGNIFCVGTNGANYKNILAFTGTGGAAIGEDPEYGNLVLAGTTLYGTASGGAYGYGTIFCVGTNGANYQNILSFTGTGGAAAGEFCTGSLTVSGTRLYGMAAGSLNWAAWGYSNGYGNIFTVGLNGSGYQNLYSFTGGTDGGLPGNCGLTLSGGTLFGMTTEGTTEVGTIFALDLAPSAWQASGGGSWTNAGNWSSPAAPNRIGVQAVLSGSQAASCTITLDGPQTVGLLTLDNGTAAYTLSAGSGGMLIMNNSGSPFSQIAVLAGTHSITAPVEIAGGSLTVNESGGGRLLISGNISDNNGAESLTLNGDGTGVLVLSGTNTYGGGTVVEAGTLIVTNNEALPDDSSLIVGSNVSLFPAYAPVIPAAAAAPVPEPGAMALLAAAGLALLALTRRRRMCPSAKPRNPARGFPALAALIVGGRDLSSHAERPVCALG